MKVTVCELDSTPARFARDWEQLVAHVRSESSQLVLLPEMPFSVWFSATSTFEAKVWDAAVLAHDRWQTRLNELAPATVLGSRPVNRGNQRLNEGFLWTQHGGYRATHHKSYLPDEVGFWEASWYQRGDGTFTPIESDGVRMGFAICTELWSMENARLYGKAGVHFLVTPRATEAATAAKWLVGGRAAAVVSGAYSLSSNHVSEKTDPVHFGGQGWIIDPDGEVLGLTSRERPFVTLDVDLRRAESAKKTYPRYSIA